MQNIVFEAGQTIFSEGDPSTHTYKILAGSVDIVIRGREGDERRVASIGPDEVFGEMGIINPGPRSATAIAREQTACAAYTADEVIALMSSEPVEAMQIIRSLILRLRNSNRKLAAKRSPSPPRKPDAM